MPDDVRGIDGLIRCHVTGIYCLPFIKKLITPQQQDVGAEDDEEEVQHGMEDDTSQGDK